MPENANSKGASSGADQGGDSRDAADSTRTGGNPGTVPVGAGPQAPGRAIAYYSLDGADIFVAVTYPDGSVPSMGAIFQLRTGAAGSLHWRHLAPGGSVWDAVHQGIFRSYRYDVVDAAALPPGTPPVPPTPAGPFPSAISEYLPEGPLGAAGYPLLAGVLRACSNQTAEVFIVLYEDTYETMFGDGEFHYLLDAFTSRQDREAFLASYQGDRIHVREMTVRLAGDVFEYPDFHHRMFDHHKVVDVLKRLEEKLGTAS